MKLRICHYDTDFDDEVEKEAVLEFGCAEDEQYQLIDDAIENEQEGAILHELMDSVCLEDDGDYTL